MKWLQASRKVYEVFVGVSFLVLICVIVLCGANWYVHIPSKCGQLDSSGEVSDFSYSPVSTSKIYLKLFYGVCRKDSTAGTEHCYLWDEEEKWSYMDYINDAVSGRQSMLADDAKNEWPVVKYLTVVSLLISFFLFVFYCLVACIGEVPWKVQIAAAVTQLILTFILCLSLGLGLRTDTVKPQMFGNYFYGCNVHAEPGASWWMGVFALVISVFAGFILMFPYMGGPTWVLKWAKAIEIAPTEDENEIHRDELVFSDEDPFAGIKLFEKERYVDDEYEDEDENERTYLNDRKGHSLA